MQGWCEMCGKKFTFSAPSNEAPILPENDNAPEDVACFFLGGYPSFPGETMLVFWVPSGFGEASYPRHPVEYLLRFGV